QASLDHPGLDIAGRRGLQGGDVVRATARSAQRQRRAAIVVAGDGERLQLSLVAKLAVAVEQVLLGPLVVGRANRATADAHGERVNITMGGWPAEGWRRVGPDTRGDNSRPPAIS